MGLQCWREGVRGGLWSPEPSAAMAFLGKWQGFPGGSDGKASAHNAGDPGLILGSGRSPGEGNGNPLQYSCLGWEDPLEKEMATHSSIHARKIPWSEEPGGLQSMGLQRAGKDWLQLFSSAWEVIQLHLSLSLSICLLISAVLRPGLNGPDWSHWTKGGERAVEWACE